SVHRSPGREARYRGGLENRFLKGSAGSNPALGVLPMRPVQISASGVPRSPERRSLKPAPEGGHPSGWMRAQSRLWMRAPYESTQESGGLQLGRDLLHSFLDVGGLASARADELPAPEQEDDDLRHVDPVHESRELLRLVLDLLQAEGDCDRVQFDLRAQVGRGDDVLDLDLRVLLDRDARRLDLLRDEVDRGLDVLEALRARAYDLPAAEQEGRRLRLLQAVDEAGELLRLVLRPAEGEGDRLQVQLAAEGGRCDDVLDLDFGH